MARLRVVAVDDDEADLELLRRYFDLLPNRDIELITLTEGQPERLAREAVDVIFLDYLLGEANGLEVLRKLRAAGNKTPVVMLTGQGDEQLAVELMKAGATDYLGKARLSPESLEQVLRNALRFHELEQLAASAEEKLRLAAKVFDNMLEGVLVTDVEANIVSVNPAFTAMTGYSEAEVLGRKPSILKSGRQDHAFYESFWATLLATGRWQGEVWNRCRDGRPYLAWQTIAAVRNGEGRTTHYVSVCSDITERKRHDELIRHQAYHDELTDLPNRRLFQDRLSQALLYAKRDGEMLAVMFLDLDHFKEINDKYGHDVGDRLLQEVAKRLKHCIRKGDSLSRFGGDEFVLLLPMIKEAIYAVQLAEKIIGTLESPLEIAGHELGIGASIGISLYPGDGGEARVLIKKADEAMYLAKQRGRNNFQLAGT